MRVWLPLLLSPLLALASLAFAYLLVGPGCNRQQGVLLHLPMAATFLTCLALTLWAARAARRPSEPLPSMLPDTPDPLAAQERRRFIAWLAMACGALCCVVIATLWLPLAALSPCPA
ncbi:hypothetical protein [Azohydromonas aeria]|uniref:hypothetical protein n=1 Tax=Azohydromonas aeria TaxID=2590212 RepID=UPI0012FA7614|nr:hypothetical protein [Azohydromonas aeria]